MTESDNGAAALDGQSMHRWMQDLFPICRSLTGNGVRQTFAYLKTLLPDLYTYEIPSGTTAFDWTVPPEWNISNASLKDENGNIIVDFANNNLHVVGYSEPVNTWLSLEELQPHLHSLEDRPDWIPYVTSYYSRRWGFCLTDRQRKGLRPGKYHARITSDLQPGHLTLGDLVIAGESDEEILFSTYICHPSMANNELSGIVMATALARWVASLRQRRYTYRFVFAPETIGSIVYIARHLDHFKNKLRAGYILTCVGDERNYSYLPSRNGGTLADRAALHCLNNYVGNYSTYSFLQRGSDERQYCAPGVDLPVASVMRTKYAIYPEYHTSADDLTLVTPAGLQGTLDVYRQMVTTLEHNRRYKIQVLCEPQLGKRGLYPEMSTRDSGLKARNLMNIIAYCDGERDLIELADTIGLSSKEVISILQPLLDNGLVEAVAV